MAGLLAFHAHPDDESISMGGTMAELAGRGVPVTVVTATRGEAGEIHGEPDPESVRPRLGEVREAEERAALAVLGVTDIEFLGYRDSGMMGTPENSRRDAFWNADFMEATGRLVRLIRDRRPTVVTAYDPFGGYGHPDHVQVHRVGTAAFFGAPDRGRFPVSEFGEPWEPETLLWASWSRDRMIRVRRAMQADLGADDPGEEPATGFLSRFLTLRRDVSRFAETKHRALLCHSTQFSAESWVRGAAADLRSEFLGEEVFVGVWAASGDPFAAL